MILVLWIDDPSLTTGPAGPGSLGGAVYLLVSALGAAVVDFAIAWYARRGCDGYVVALIAGLAGYFGAWFVLRAGGFEF